MDNTKDGPATGIPEPDRDELDGLSRDEVVERYRKVKAAQSGADRKVAELSARLSEIEKHLLDDSSVAADLADFKLKKHLLDQALAAEVPIEIATGFLSKTEDDITRAMTSLTDWVARRELKVKNDLLGAGKPPLGGDRSGAGLTQRQFNKMTPDQIKDLGRKEPGRWAAFLDRATKGGKHGAR